jgi:hypothetical protein
MMNLSAKSGAGWVITTDVDKAHKKSVFYLICAKLKSRQQLPLIRPD